MRLPGNLAGPMTKAAALARAGLAMLAGLALLAGAQQSHAQPPLAQPPHARAAPVQAVAPAGPPPRPAIVSAGRIAGDENSVRMFFDLDRKIDFHSFLMADPARVVIDGPSMLFQLENSAGLEPRGLVDFLRFGAIAPDRSRIVITLARPATISAISLRELDGGAKYRLVVDLAAVEQPEFDRLLASQQENLGKSGETARKGDRVVPPDKEQGSYVVVIDPGHGGIDGGAKGAHGTYEKELTLDVARQLADELAGGPFVVKMTREEDFFVSLDERVNFARRHQADLVISIHADSLRQKWVRGASIYTLSERASDRLAAELAESEKLADIIAGLDSPEEEAAVSGILADLTARETKKFSRSFAATLVDEMREDVAMLKNPQRSASFAILKAPEVPGVLVELGYLSNEEDEKLLKDPRWQQDIVRVMAKAVRAFFLDRR